MINKVRGVRDIFGEEARLFNQIESVISNIAAIYGFTSLNIPIFEYAEVYERNLGEESDIVSKEIYKFEDRGGRSIALRPEFTAGVARAFLENAELNQKLPQKLFSFGPLFRYDRPQKGRQRQFHQANFEYIGEEFGFADLEMILLASRILGNLGIKNTKLHINFLCSDESMAVYKQKLMDYLNSYKSSLSEDSLRRLESNPLRILDSKDEGDRRILANAPKISDSYNADDRQNFKFLFKILEDFGLDYIYDEKLVRGLDYYTGTIFEFVSYDGKMGAQSTILAGGRYDKLIGQMGSKRKIPAIGFASGIERLMLLAEMEVSNFKIIAIIPNGSVQKSLELAELLRNSGMVCNIQYNGKIKDAVENGAFAAIFVGEGEEYRVRLFENREDFQVPQSELLNFLGK